VQILKERRETYYIVIYRCSSMLECVDFDLYWDLSILPINLPAPP
jgi:hypothetical protein